MARFHTGSVAEASLFIPGGGIPAPRCWRALSLWSPEQNEMLDSWVEVNPRQEYFSHFSDDFDFDLDEDGDGDQYWEDDRDDYEDWTRANWQGPPS